MMKGHKMKHTFVMLFLLAVVLASCDNGSDASLDAVEQQVTSIPVFLQQRKAAPGMETKGTDGEEGDTGNDEGNGNVADTASIIIESFKEGDLLYFSQMGPTQIPNFTEPKEEAFPYLYIYEYKENDETPNWDKGENFSVLEKYIDKKENKEYSDRQSLDWTTVKDVGSVGNAFSLYAFHFPVDNEVRFNVETDQRGTKGDPYDKTNFMKSDILGAYHATSSLYTRLRFRLFHLMVYLKVTLYVPEYKLEDSNTNSTGLSYSGFNKNAVQGAYVMNAATEFDIEWRANRSSDTEAPLTQSKTAPKKNIAMYFHKSDEKVIDFKVKDYYTGIELETDRVREYTFSVLFPTQTFEDNFLCFALTSPIAEKETKYYYFSGSQVIGSSGNYGMTQGTLQQLYLYLPRKKNETILVGAKILPWNNAMTDMTVTEEKTSGDSETN